MLKKLLSSKSSPKLLQSIKENFEFPIFKTKMRGISRSFDLSKPEERRKYFQLKAGSEIKKLKRYLKHNTFIAYLLGKKNSGKGTYSKMFEEIVGKDYIIHLSVGDLVRGVEEEIKDKKRRKELIDFLKQNYRGYISLEESLRALQSRSTKNLLPTELILALIKREIDKHPKKTLFIDGFPRELDQIAYSLFFRDLAGYRYDPDIFILISVPEAVINERIKYRVVCPICHTPRNLRLAPTSKIGYDKKKKTFYLICDNPKCKGARMVQKEGDRFGIRLIKKRLKLDERLMRYAFSLYGIPKILLRNAVPVKEAERYVDDYEITPIFSYKWSDKEKKVKIIKKPWIFPDDKRIPSYSLLPAPVVVSMIKQMVKILNL